MKFHKLRHYADNIREWGCPSNTNAETWESAHKWFVKRWMGKMQYNRNGSINMVMRRNRIAEIHRGSEDLLPQHKRKHSRDDYSVINAVSGSTDLYRQFYHASNAMWVHCGDAVQFMDDSDDNDHGSVARVESIRKSSSGILSLVVTLYNVHVICSGENSRPLERVTQKWVLETDVSLRITIHPIEDELTLYPFPLQPDFDNFGVVFFSCPWMRIVL